MAVASYFLILKLCISANIKDCHRIDVLITVYYVNNCTAIYLVLFLGICQLCQVCVKGNQMIHRYDLLSELFQMPESRFILFEISAMRHGLWLYSTLIVYKLFTFHLVYENMKYFLYLVNDNRIFFYLLWLNPQRLTCNGEENADVLFMQRSFIEL